MNNPWKIVGVHRQTTQKELRDAYLTLAKAYHPDKHGCADKCAELNVAYTLLKNPKKLKAYIAELEILGNICTKCRGNGAHFKQQGLTSRISSGCPACEGSGIIEKRKV